MVERLLEQNILKHWDDPKAVIILGPRQSGKTTLVNSIARMKKMPMQFWSGDDFSIRSMLGSISIATLNTVIGGSKIIIIDEAQRIENIGLCIKMLIDHFPGVKVMATGSSAFELANRLNEPMTGRKWEYLLLPFSFKEMVGENGIVNEQSLMEQRMVYGYYPDVVNNPGQEKEILKQLADSYLYKDILLMERVNKTERLEKLVQALAFQVGNEVSYHELGQFTGLDNQTVEKYIDLLEKAFVVFRIGSLSRNLRNELKKSRKIYFFDNGLRNAIINAFNPLSLRADTGQLWENFMMSERLKYLKTHDVWCSRFFWRTTAQQEIDYVEESDGKTYGYEFKRNPNIKKSFPKAFLNAYPGSETKYITPDSFYPFLGIVS
jgi:predicted AAA+ superfamily ATPase